jgi:hypothetical protein
VSAPSRPLLIGLLVTLAVAGVYFVALKPPGKGNDSPYNAPISDAQKAVVQSQVAAAKAQAAAGNAAQAAAGDPSAAPAATAKPPTALGNASKAQPHHVVVVKPAAVKPAVTPHAAAKPAAASGSSVKLAPWDRSAKVFAALAKHKVAVMLFWTKGGADDNSVRRAVAQVSKRPRVAIFTMPMADVGKYAAITTNIPIDVSPTVLVISPSRNYIPISGYTTAAAIDQAITAVR